MSQILRLNDSSSHHSIVARETYCRIWWSLYAADAWVSNGLGIDYCIPRLGEGCDTPMDEATFRSMTCDQTTYPIARWKPGFWAHLTSLMTLAASIQNFAQRALSSYIDRAETSICIQNLEAKLDRWYEELGNDLKMSIPNLNRHIRNDLGRNHVFLHLTYHHYYMTLYFPFLHDQISVQADSQAYTAKCRDHARSFGDLLALSQNMQGCDINYPTVVQMTAISSYVAIHTLLFCEESEIHAARETVNANIESLKRFQRSWPLASMIV